MRNTIRSTDGVIAIGLLLILAEALTLGATELSMSIAGVLGGYLGRGRLEGKHETDNVK